MLELFQPGPPGDEAPGQRPEARVVDADEKPRLLVCSACRNPVASTGDRIEIAGAHVHTCVNPHGYRYRIGCFAAARGLEPVGPPSHEHTWFPGYAWQVQDCARCHQLLGWRYTSADGGFFGLVLAHLVELYPDEPLH
jgi:hypothetical protein